MKSPHPRIKKILGAVGIVAAVLFALIAFDTICPFRRITGFPCPGCGMTRALFAAAKLDFATAFEMHPMWPFVLPMVAMFLYHTFGKSQRKRRFCEISLIVIGVIFIAVYIVRIATGSAV